MRRNDDTVLNPRLPLLVKDGVRELRFTMRRVARNVLENLHGQSARVPAWAPPLDQAADVASQVLHGLDRLASDLLSSDSEYRHMNFRLLSVQADRRASLGSCTARDFRRHFYWVFVHLLSLERRNDVSAHEEAIHRSWQSFHETSIAPPEAAAAEVADAAEEQSRKCAELVLALCQHRPLGLHASTALQREAGGDELGDPGAALTLKLAVAAVLAGEIAAAYPCPSAVDEVANALHLARSMSAGRQKVWQAALDSADPQQALAHEFAFVLRHL